jgi:hypothetical protein
MAFVTASEQDIPLELPSATCALPPTGNMLMGGIKELEKHGGKSGDWVAG